MKKTKRPNLRQVSINRSKMDTYGIVVVDGKTGEVKFDGPKRLREDMKKGNPFKVEDRKTHVLNQKKESERVSTKPKKEEKILDIKQKKERKKITNKKQKCDHKWDIGRTVIAGARGFEFNIEQCKRCRIFRMVQEFDDIQKKHVVTYHEKNPLDNWPFRLTGYEPFEYFEISD